MKRITRRSFIKGAGLTLAGATLVACSPSSSAPTSQATDVPASQATESPSGAESGKIVLRFASWDSSSGQDVYNSITNEFNKTAPNIEVKVEFTPDSYDDKILTGLAGGNAPDIFMWWNYPGLIARKGILDLTEYATLPGDKGLDLNQYYPEVLAYAKIGNILVGTPNAFTPRAIFYNKKLFAEAGLPEPTSDWTLDEFTEIAQKLTKGEGADKVYGMFMSPGTYHLQGYIWSNGGDWISPDGTRASGFCDSPETIEVIKWASELVTKLGVAPTDDTGTTLGGATQMFINGKLAMMDNGRWPQTDLMKAENLDFGLVLHPINPNTKKRVTVLHTSAFCVNPATKYKDEAWQFAKFIGGPVGNKLFGQAGWAVPAVPSAVKELGWETDPIEKVWIEAIPYATVQPCFMRTTAWDKADSEFYNALQAVWLGQATPEEAMKKVAPIVDDILANAPKIS
ncbi:ABC-type sugar transport system, periplasmic component [Anaerolinea thermolimosa]|uniref:extracellular solute-binding protein n=1 Tax=Anaerolinea thermolimosa TaxID=229919 RepID=UPI000783D741|nr:extracellular solute-binding protein [Anaerolinea thermolimosa]GAP05182.1 ABC-type sugar transport system, periplasmic component [Anaerolinea thermolimosa]